MFNMRGFSANNSLFVDGVRDDGLISRDVYNLEQIEVFSGPTGSDVGRTNAAGYINLTTKTPNLESAQAGTLSYGAGDQVRATLDVNQPVAFGERGTFLGNAAIRVNALWQDGGTAGRDYAARESKSIAPVDRLRPQHADARQPLRPDHAAGQPRRLRPAGGGVSDRPADRHVDRRRHARRTVELLRQSRLRLRPRQPGQRHAARSSTTSRPA